MVIEANSIQKIIYDIPSTKKKYPICYNGIFAEKSVI
jgi:hypothetical protein